MMNPLYVMESYMTRISIEPSFVFQQREAAPHPPRALRGQVRQMRAVRVHRDGGGGREAHRHQPQVIRVRRVRQDDPDQGSALRPRHGPQDVPLRPGMKKLKT